jgi:hypothetical protein
MHDDLRALGRIGDPLGDLGEEAAEVRAGSHDDALLPRDRYEGIRDRGHRVGRRGPRRAQQQSRTDRRETARQRRRRVQQ